MVGDLAKAVATALEELPEVAVHAVRKHARVSDREVDLAIEGEIKGRPVRLLVNTRAAGNPRDVHQAVRELVGLRRLDQPVADVPLFAAPVITQRSRELLREHRIGYWDEGGSVYLDLPWAYLRVDRPPRRGQPRPRRALFQGSAAQVLHTLLLDPSRAWHLSELAERADVSVSTAHQVSLYLEEQLWVEKQGRGPRAVRLLREPGALLEAWASAHSLDRYDMRRFHRWTRSHDELVSVVVDACSRHGVDYALTLVSGAQSVAPFGTEHDRVWMLIPSDAADRLDDVTRSAGLQPVDEGENVAFLVTHERAPLLFRRRVHERWVASDVQLYLDLSAWPRRGKEQAAHLRAERLHY